MKMASNWVSVRKAFLDLDSDYDGFITPEDFSKHFGNSDDITYDDMRLLIQKRS
jgi:hypothetical protein